MRLALGIADDLGEFARQHDALTYTHWDFTDWRGLLPQLAGDGATEIVWNLTYVEIEAGLHRAVLAETAGIEISGATDWELLQFCRSSEWRSRSRFFIDGLEISDPFAVIGWCDHGHE
jgi:hypothetical protein